MEELVVIDGCGNPELKKCFDCDSEKAGGNLEHCGMCEEGWQRALGKLYDLEKSWGKILVWTTCGSWCRLTGKAG